LSEKDKEWLRELWVSEWGGDTMVTRGRVHRLSDLNAVIAYADGTRAGAATFRIEEGECELLSLNALQKGQGIGGALIAEVERKAREAGCIRVWLITTNDNLDALRFYQRRGYRITAVYPGAVDEARMVKPTIPLEGEYGIPIHDEIELEKQL
jgi:GNAT superfamily N-acetyltransferase